MRVRPALVAALAGAVVAASGPASAACQMVRSQVPVEMQGLHPTVLAKVDGRAVRFILDSGSFFSGISAKVAAARKLRRLERPPPTGTRLYSEAQTRFTGVGGATRAEAMVEADEFEFAGVDYGRTAFLALPIEEGGVLGQNFLKLADVDYDLGAGDVAMVKVQDCEKSAVVYWVAARRPYSMLPLDRGEKGRHTVATVLVNGRPMKAVFDTGAEASFITRRAATRAGVEVTAPNVKEAGLSYGFDRVPVRTWIARFDSVKLDTEEVVNGLLAIGDTESKDFDMLIGADFFLSHHIYVANSQDRIYFTHTKGPAFNPAASHPILPPQTQLPTPRR